MISIWANSLVKGRIHIPYDMLLPLKNPPQKPCPSVLPLTCRYHQVHVGQLLAGSTPVTCTKNSGDILVVSSLFFCVIEAGVEPEKV